MTSAEIDKLLEEAEAWIRKGNASLGDILLSKLMQAVGDLRECKCGEFGSWEGMFGFAVCPQHPDWYKPLSDRWTKLEQQNVELRAKLERTKRFVTVVWELQRENECLRTGCREGCGHAHWRILKQQNAELQEEVERCCKELGGAGVLITQGPRDGIAKLINERDGLRAKLEHEQAEHADAERELNKARNKLERAKETLEHYADCNLNTDNCASFEVANRRIKNIATQALAAIEGK